jgi:hypothetical protein
MKVVSPNVLSGDLALSRNAPSSGSGSSWFGSMLSGWGTMIVAVLILMVLFAVYYETVGYYIQLGWNKMNGSKEREETVQIDIPGSGGALSAQLTPVPHGSANGAPFGTGLEKVMNTLESDVAAALGGGSGSSGKQVFNVSRNVYRFTEAEPLCRAFGAELATYDQVKDAYKAGADWCNYGWVKGQLAVYPTQKETYEKLQHGPEHERMSCGLPGVNGGYFPNEDQRFGVNCYGPKPAETALDERLQQEENSDIEFDRQVNHFKSERDTISVAPWSKGTWSG